MAPFTRFDATKFVVVIAVIVVVAGIGFFSVQWLLHWHQQDKQAAVKQVATDLVQEKARLEKRLDHLEQELAEKKPPEISDKRLTEVFGKPPSVAARKTKRPGCAELAQRIDRFFDYLDSRGIPFSAEEPAGGGDAEAEAAADESPDAARVFYQMMADLAAHPPVVVGETRDVVTLMRNQVHFFRTLNEERIKVVKHLLNTEADILEYALADFYAYHVRRDCCQGGQRFCPELPALYEYAGFFLNTLAGSRYLLRRDKAIRTLARYYSILILDRANDENLNPHGLDIRPHINRTLADLSGQANLVFQAQYQDRLKQLQQKYVKN